MSGEGTASRSLFVASLLVEAEPAHKEPLAAYDEDRGLTVLSDGTPLVEAGELAGTHTMTKNTGERDDADDHARSGVSLGTLTSTAVTGEREDDDASETWGGTQVDTRRMPADVEQD